MPMSSGEMHCKRLLDIVVALSAIIIFLPVFILVPLLIKREDGGDIFFRQKRFGQGGVLFDCLKFRSMTVLSSANKDIILTQRNDPRLTKMGKFLRSTSIDEFPQFLNVLKGEMSVVGPRPHPPGVRAGERTYENIIPEFMQRYRVKPGITGLAQVRGARGNTFTEDDIKRRFSYDMDYIKNWSLWGDITIIARTLIIGFVGKNAF